MTENKVQRKFDRYPLSLMARCIIAGKPTGADCIVTEISRGGAGMYLSVQDELKTGQNLMLDIYIPGKLAPVNVIMKVTYAKPVDDHGEFNYFVGGKMTHIKVDDREALLDYAFRQIFDDETIE